MRIIQTDPLPFSRVSAALVISFNLGHSHSSNFLTPISAHTHDCIADSKILLSTLFCGWFKMRALVVSARRAIMPFALHPIIAVHCCGYFQLPVAFRALRVWCGIAAMRPDMLPTLPFLLFPGHEMAVFFPSTSRTPPCTPSIRRS